MFDLDGTLTDSGEGIIHCAQLTLEHYGLPVPAKEDMRWMVGPPLRTSFPKFGISPEKIEEAIALYRSYYVPMGMFENEPYPGIHQLLQRLKADGHRLFVATSKPEQTAVEILKRFDLAQYFEVICGAQMYGVRDQKAEVIAYILNAIGSKENAVMVGDTVFDVIGAAEQGIPAIGVSWGYGQVSDMENAGAQTIVNNMEQLYQYLSG